MAQFFIERPIFAWVVGILVMLGGALSIFRLPVSQYPAIAPPTVSVSTNYPGASAKTLEDTVTQVIEQRMNGLDHLRYMASSSDSAGNAQVTLTFDAGTDPDIAQVQVQNKLAARHAAAPAGGAAPGRPGGQVGLQLHAHHRPRLRGRVDDAATTSPTTPTPRCRTPSAACPAWAR